MPIKGTYVTLRAPEQCDLESMREIRNIVEDRYQYRTWREISKYKQETYYWNEVINSPNHIVFVIEDNTTKKVVGECRASFIDWTNSNAEMAIVLHTDYRRKGYGKEAMSLFIEYLFKYANLHRLVAIICKANKSSLRMFESAGFLYEGTLKDYKKYKGKYHDAVQLSCINRYERN